jgi:hypothetical protein
MNALLVSGGLNEIFLLGKLICFGANGVSIFQGVKIGVTKHIKEFWVPFSMGFHCVAHRANLTLQSLYDLIFIARLDSFVTNFYGYFNHSPKRHLEFQRLVHILETIGNKILKIVKTE